MSIAHQEEIEFLRKNIEDLTLPSNEDILKETKNKKKLKKNLKKKFNNSELLKSKINNKIISDDEKDENDYSSKEKEININKSKEEKEKQRFQEKKIEIEKIFNDIYDNIYIKDAQYFCEQRTKQFKEVHYDSIECRGVYFPKKKKNKFDLNEIFEIIEKNDHQMRYEAEYEDEFISSDSYDNELFNLKTKVNKNFIIKTKQSLIENKDNLNEIVKAIKICKERGDDENSRIKEIKTNNNYI